MEEKRDIELIFSDRAGALKAFEITEIMICVYFRNNCELLPPENMKKVNADGRLHDPERNEEKEDFRLFEKLLRDYRLMNIRFIKSGAPDPGCRERTEKLLDRIRVEDRRFVFSDCSGLGQTDRIEGCYFEDYFSLICFFLAVSCPGTTFEGMRRVSASDSCTKQILTRVVWDGSTLSFRQMEGDPVFNTLIVSWTLQEDWFVKKVRSFSAAQL